MGKWVDFKKIRAEIDNEQVLKDYGVKLTGSGDQRRTHCPIPSHGDAKDDKKSFSINLNKGIWQCFSCGAKGNMIDFAAYMEGLDPECNDDIRKAAIMLQERYLAKATIGCKNSKPQRQTRKKQNRGKQPRRLVNPPLDFELKSLDSRHSCFEELGLEHRTIDYFGLGYCSRGYLKGRIAIPLHDAQGELIGYAGMSTQADMEDDHSEKYLFPETRKRNGVILEFDRSRVLYNEHQLTSPAQDVIVTQWFPMVWQLWQTGHTNVIAIMATTCRDEQAKLIVDSVYAEGHVWIVSNNHERDRYFAASVLERLSPFVFIRWIQCDRQSTPSGVLSLPVQS